ncbi:MAG: S49 family peptidase [Planctomycetes bacterium]|nr:S49 family peptidase [Planctomycetota bacterium]
MATFLAIMMRRSAAAVAVAAVLALAAPAAPAAAKTAVRAHPKKRTAPLKKVELKKAVAEKETRPRIAQIRLEGSILSSPPLYSWFPDQAAGVTLRQWLQRLAKARNDQRVRAVALEIGPVELDWAEAQELSDAIRRLSAVKAVYVHMTDGGAMTYLLASAGREVTMDPSGTLTITGLGAELMFFRGTLDLLGIRAQMVQIGKYKGAAEPFTRTSPSDEFKGEFNRLLDDLYDQLRRQIAAQRGLTIPQVTRAIDNAPLTAEDALKYRLVDRLVAAADWRQYVSAKLAGKPRGPVTWLADYEAPKPRQLDLSNPLSVLGLMLAGRPRQATREPTVAIIHADGMIVSGSSGEGLFGGRYVGHKTLIECFKKAAADPHVKAVVFRVNSPGGSALASELIYQAVRKCDAKKPVIVSISGMGASGGYYIALGGRKILADASAVTGSIGVVSGKLAVRGLLDKLGISTWAMTRGRNAGLTLVRAWKGWESGGFRS